MTFPTIPSQHDSNQKAGFSSFLCRGQYNLPHQDEWKAVMMKFKKSSPRAMEDMVTEKIAKIISCPFAPCIHKNAFRIFERETAFTFGFNCLSSLCWQSCFNTFFALFSSACGVVRYLAKALSNEGGVRGHFYNFPIIGGMLKPDNAWNKAKRNFAEIIIRCIDITWS